MSVEHRTPVYDLVSGAFRKRRNHALLDAIVSMSSRLERPVEVLDVGGVENFWIDAEVAEHRNVTVVNTARAFTEPHWFGGTVDLQHVEGTALDLAAFRGRFDLVVCNSVIEHVGRWDEIDQCARELRAVTPAGWVQTPAFGFPIEPHFALPFVHWLGEPIRARLLGVLPHHDGGDATAPDRGRRAVEENNLLTYREFNFLFPTATIHRERLLGWTKSFIAEWGLGTL